ncbi:hypothetical protein F0562_022166 [Nyssa sinensis]|uniref:Phytosulfokine n=1 Tax=Nyssa sinensis TaxID=561372 RepID=A0A5J5BN68_9ASTE|nr:hypothetical protein F0562_022166 [Nyssa sinensis]
MKQNFCSCALLLLFLFLLTSSKTSGRFIATKQGEEEMKLDEITTEGASAEMESNDSLNQLMGLEICNNRDVECLKRRIVAEAHLDYIYTQHHKP